MVAAGAEAAPTTDLTALPIEQLLELQVQGASRYPQQISEAPAAVSIVTAEDIKTFGYRTLADVLNSIRGLYLSYDRNYHYLGVRGFSRAGDYNTRALLLVDGVRNNDNIYDQAAIGTDFGIDIDLIDRVEFIAGPGSSVYGPNAFFGVINVITRNGGDFNGAKVSLEAGSARTGKARATYGGRTENGAEWLVSASRYSQRGRDLHFSEFDTPGNNGGVARNLDFDRSTSLFAKLKASELTLTLAHGERKKGTPTASFDQVFDDGRSQVVDTHTSLGAEYRRELKPQLAMTARAQLGYYRYRGDYVYDYPPLTVNHDDSVGNWWGGELHFVSTAFKGQKLAYGGEYRRDTRIDQANYDIAPFFSYLDDRRRAHSYGVYAQDEVALRDDLILNAGLRYDQQSLGGGTANPRLGLIYKLRPATTLKAVYGTAYRTPNAYERYYIVGGSGSQGFKPNPGLAAEHIRSAELVFEHAPDAGQRFLVSLFRNDVRDLISLATDPADGNLMFQNVQGARAKGLEAEWERRWADGLRLKGSYSWQMARDAETGALLPNAPRHLVKLHFSGPFFGARNRYGLEVLGASARKTLAAEVPSYALANLTLLTTQLARGVELSASIYNLFDRRYFDPASAEFRQDALEQNGRSLRLKMGYQF